MFSNGLIEHFLILMIFSIAPIEYGAKAALQSCGICCGILHLNPSSPIFSHCFSFRIPDLQHWLTHISVIQILIQQRRCATSLWDVLWDWLWDLFKSGIVVPCGSTRTWCTPVCTEHSKVADCPANAAICIRKNAIMIDNARGLLPLFVKACFDGGCKDGVARSGVSVQVASCLESKEQKQSPGRTQKSGP